MTEADKHPMQALRGGLGHPGSVTAMLNYCRALRERPRTAEPARLAPPILWAGDDVFLGRSVAEAGLVLCDHGKLEIIDGVTHWPCRAARADQRPNHRVLRRAALNGGHQTPGVRLSEAE